MGGRPGRESRVAIAAAILSAALANCPNGCSGNGLCGANDKCSCQQLFMGADCSHRRCPYALAWADTADGTNQAHYYAECANKGYCDRKTGICQCFEGFEGKGCRRSSCPDGCSGHGLCQTTEELSQDWYSRRYGPGAEMKDLSCTNSRQFPSKSGALTASFVLAGLSDANLLVTTDAYFYADAYSGMPVKYDSNYGTLAATTKEVQTFSCTGTVGTAIATWGSGATNTASWAPTATLATVKTQLETITGIGTVTVADAAADGTNQFCSGGARTITFDAMGDIAQIAMVGSTGAAVKEVQTFSCTGATGTVVATWGSGATNTASWAPDATLATVKTQLETITGIGTVTVADAAADGTDQFCSGGARTITFDASGDIAQIAMVGSTAGGDDVAVTCSASCNTNTAQGSDVTGVPADDVAVTCSASCNTNTAQSTDVTGVVGFALTNDGIYYLYKSATANTFVVFTTEAQAKATNYANEAAAKAATGALDVKTGTTAGETHYFTEAYRDSCQQGSLIASPLTPRTANSDVIHGQLYQEWDRGMTQACRCDPGYDGPDCARRIPPHGDDPLTSRKANTMRQAVKINGASSTSFERQEFSLTYHDPYGGIWRSEAILGSTDDTKVASRVQNALRRLPNEVLEGVKVTGTSTTPSICHRFDDGVQHLAAHKQIHKGHHKDAKYNSNFCKHSHTELAPAADDMDFTVEFNSIAGQTGVQYLLEVDVSKRGGGHYPVSAGITGASTYSVGEINYNANLGNLSELAECSDRGLDNGEGECECFEGFRGLSCEKQEALV